MTTTPESDDERAEGIREDTTERDPEFLRQRNAEEYAHRFPKYWTREERDAWKIKTYDHWFVTREESRRILATVDALEKALTVFLVGHIQNCDCEPCDLLAALEAK